MDDFSAMQGVVLVSQRLVLLLEESSLWLPLCQAEWGFFAEPPISKSSNAVGEQGVSIPGVGTASTTS